MRKTEKHRRKFRTQWPLLFCKFLQAKSIYFNRYSRNFTQVQVDHVDWLRWLVHYIQCIDHYVRHAIHSRQWSFFACKTLQKFLLKLPFWCVRDCKQTWQNGSGLLPLIIHRAVKWFIAPKIRFCLCNICVYCVHLYKYMYKYTHTIYISKIVTCIFLYYI